MNYKKELPPKETLERLANQCRTIREMSDIVGITPKLCSKALNAYGIEFSSAYRYDKPNISHPEIDKDWLVKNWVNTDKSIKAISLEIGVPDSLLEYRISKFGLKKGHKYKINAIKLLNAYDPNVAYVAGLLATDGYVNTNADFVSIRLCGESERNLLQDILNYFESDAPVAYYDSSNKSYSIRLSCDGVKKFFLDEFNVLASDKTFSVKVPNAFKNEDCAKSYVLGCMDGDGCISHLKHGVDMRILTASEDFAFGLKSIIEQYAKVKVNLQSVKNKFRVVSVGGKQNLIKFLDWVYSTNAVLRLDRKYRRYLEVKDIVCSTVQS